MDLSHFKSITGSVLAGIWTNQLFVSKTENDEKYRFGDLILNLKNEGKTAESWYWRIYWFEDEEGDDLLKIEEQQTPEPLKYYIEPEISDDPLILASNIALENNLINKVSGYGLKVNSETYLTSVVFELEKQFVIFTLAGPTLIEATISTEKMNGLGDLIFTL